MSITIHNIDLIPEDARDHVTAQIENAGERVLWLTVNVSSHCGADARRKSKGDSEWTIGKLFPSS